MSTSRRTEAQLGTIGWLHEALGEQRIEYWLFGGWAVDFHAGRVTREHGDVDVAVWLSDVDQLKVVLQANDWLHVPDPSEDGYTAFEKGDLRLEVAFLARDETGTVFTPLRQGQPIGRPGPSRMWRRRFWQFGLRVVGLASLIEDKSGPRDDALAALKDSADVATLRGLSPSD